MFSSLSVCLCAEKGGYLYHTAKQLHSGTFFSNRAMFMFRIRGLTNSVLCLCAERGGYLYHTANSSTLGPFMSVC